MFTSKLEEITYEKINRFCEEQNPECETIEYKGDFPKDLEKSISAMANTYGGIILIGVKADKIRNVPILPIEGRDLAEGLEEKVISICLRKIYQPYFPLVKVCPLPNVKGENKCVVFIRVYESDQTPHAINNNTDVYFRIKSQNEPFRKATIDEIEWLKNRRQKAIENREKLLKVADRRFLSMPYDSIENLQLRMSPEDLRSSYRKASIIPLYPTKPLLQYMELSDLKETFHNPRDPVFVLDNPLSVSGSLCFPYVREHSSDSLEWLNYTEFNIYGLIYNKQSLLENAYPETKALFDVSYLLKQIFRVVTVGTAIYEKAGNYGSVLIEVEAEGILGKRVGVIDYSLKRIRDQWCTNIVEPNITVKKICSFIDLKEKLSTLIVEICEEFLWCCGAGARIKEFENRLKYLVEQTKESFSSIDSVS